MIVSRQPIHPDMWVGPIVEGDRSLRGVAWEWMDAKTLALYDLYAMAETATAWFALYANEYAYVSGDQVQQFRDLVAASAKARDDLRGKLDAVLRAAEVDLLVEPSNRVPKNVFAPEVRYGQRCLVWWRGEIRAKDWSTQVREWVWRLADSDTPRPSRLAAYDAANEPNLSTTEAAA